MKLILLYTFYGGRKQTTLSLRTWVKWTYIWHFKQVEINGTKFKKSAFILEVTMSLLMPKVVLLLKLPMIHSLHTEWTVTALSRMECHQPF